MVTTIKEVTTEFLGKFPGNTAPLRELSEEWSHELDCFCLGYDMTEFTLECAIMQGIITYDQEADKVTLVPEQNREKIITAIYLRHLSRGDELKAEKDSLYSKASKRNKRLYDALENDYKRRGQEVLREFEQYFPKPYRF